MLKKFSLQFVSAGSCRPSTHGLGARSAAYAGMAFSESELQAVVGDIAAAMRELGLGSPEVGDLVDLLLALNPDGISSPCA